WGNSEGQLRVYDLLRRELRSGRPALARGNPDPTDRLLNVFRGRLALVGDESSEKRTTYMSGRDLADRFSDFTFRVPDGDAFCWLDCSPDERFVALCHERARQASLILDYLTHAAARFGLKLS